MNYTFGWDGASYQGVPDVARLRREGHEFCIEKVTGEGTYVNPVWRQVRDACRQAGVLFGTYDWCEPQGALGGADAAADYLRVVGERRAGDLLTVDFETPEWFTGPLGRAIEPWMRAYLYALRDKAGQPVIVYTGPYFLDETGARDWAWLGRDFHLWQAAPGAGMLADDSSWPATPAPFARTLLHQHQWYATSAAVVGQFDRDRFAGTREELLAYGYGGAVTTQTTTTTTGGAEVREPNEGEHTVYINERGNTLIAINLGGEATAVEGYAIVDAGATVVNPQGERYARSVQQNVMQAWQGPLPPK